MNLFRKEEVKHRKLNRFDKQLADTIKSLRLKSELTQEQLSEKLGMHLNYISRLERYQNGVSLPILYKLSKIFGIKVKDLFEF